MKQPESRAHHRQNRAGSLAFWGSAAATGAQNKAPNTRKHAAKYWLVLASFGREISAFAGVSVARAKYQRHFAFERERTAPPGTFKWWFCSSHHAGDLSSFCNTVLEVKCDTVWIGCWTSPCPKRRLLRSTKRSRLARVVACCDELFSSVSFPHPGTIATSVALSTAPGSCGPQQHPSTELWPPGRNYFDFPQIPARCQYEGRCWTFRAINQMTGGLREFTHFPNQILSMKKQQRSEPVRFRSVNDHPGHWPGTLWS